MPGLSARPVPPRRRRTIIACPGCGTIHRTRGVPRGAVAICRVCRTKLFNDQRGNMQGVVALNIAAFILFAMAHLYPFLTLDIEGRAQTSTFLTGPWMLFELGYWPLALVVFLAASLMPALRMLTTFWLLAPMLAGDRPPYGAALMRFSQFLRPWSMLEIFFLGVLVAYVKLSDLAQIQLHMAVFSFVGALFLLTIADSIVEQRAIWERLGRQARVDPRRPLPEGLAACHECGQLDVLPPEGHGRCPRCSAVMHRRKPDSLARSWALVAAAAVLYIPANVLPVMTVTYFGRGEPDTIMSGVRQLLAAGQVPIALLVFTASIAVPVLKLLGMSWLLIGVQRGSLRGRLHRTSAYFLIAWIGRWSMVDVFMISILVSLVSLGAIATIEPGVGAISFAAVVLLTMVAAECFDPRLIWDAEGDDRDGRSDARV